MYIYYRKCNFANCINYANCIYKYIYNHEYYDFYYCVSLYTKHGYLRNISLLIISLLILHNFLIYISYHNSFYKLHVYINIHSYSVASWSFYLKKRFFLSKLSDNDQLLTN